jgi:PPOX class probable F420-dependent enzyme
MKLPDRFGRALVRTNKRLLDWQRSGEAASILDQPVGHGDFSSLRGHNHMLLVTYRRDGRAVPTPVWFGPDGDRVYVWTEENAYKAKRLRRDPRALVAPCSPRGRPLGPPIAARGRVIEDAAGRDRAAQVIRSSWGPLRRAFERSSRPVTGVVYIELQPEPAGANV